MVIWHVQRLYTSKGCVFAVLPYDFRGTIKGTLKMKRGIRQLLKFMLDSRLTVKSVYSLCKKKNRIYGYEGTDWKDVLKNGL